MFLKKIEIHGFKSFANKTELQFNQNLTAIVGPNGSGKSNIADAIRWATGEQSQKLLRTKKSEEVIFAGSDKKNRLGMAEVNLYLDNSQRKMPIDYKDVIITRRVFRTGESEYIINKSKVRLIDIQLLLANANFGQHNYSIIGQGMIDLILIQSSASRKAFFDEATGVKVHQIKKEKAQRKYTNTQNNLKQSKMLLNEISPRLKYLTRQVNKLNKKQEIEEKLEKLQNNYYGFLVSEIQKDIQETKEKLDSKNKTKNQLNNGLDEIQDKLNEEENKNSYANEFNQLQEKHEELINLKNRLSHDRVIYEAKLDLEPSSKGKNSLSWINKQKTELEREFHNNQNKLSEYNNKLKNIEEELENKTIKQNEFIEKINKIQSKLQKNIEEDIGLGTNELKEKIKRLNESLQKIIKEIDEMSHKDLKKEIYFIAKEIEYLNKKANKEKSFNPTEDKKEYNELQKEFQRYLTSKDSLVNEIYEFKNQKNLAENKIKDLRNRQEEISTDLKKIILEIEINKSEDKSENQRQIENAIQEIDEKIEEINRKITKVKVKINELDKKNEKDRKDLFEIQRETREIQSKLNDINYKIQEINIELAKHEAHYEDLLREIEYENVNKEKLNYNIEEIDKYETFKKINRLKNQMNQIGGIEEDVDDEFHEVKEKHEFLEKQIVDLDKASKNLKEMIDDLNKKIEGKFYLNFKKINETFNKYFRVLFDGGSANLSIQKETLEDIKKDNEKNEDENNNEENEDEIEDKTYEGKAKVISDIIISVKLPGKKQANMTFLSGGEKALTSIALICAIIYNNPSPFVVLDEVDAALDEANSERFAEIIDNLKNKTQFICITHNRATMHKAETLYGVTMDSNGVSKLLSINFNEAQKYSD